MEKVTVRIGTNKRTRNVRVAPPRGIGQTTLYPQSKKGIKTTLKKNKEGNIAVQVFLLNNKILEKKSSNFDISPASSKKARLILRNFPFSIKKFIDLEDQFLSEVKRLLRLYLQTDKCTGSMQKMIDISIKLQTLFGDMSHHRKYFKMVLSCKSFNKNKILA